MTPTSTLSHKARALWRDRRHAGARMRHKLGVWMNRLTSPSELAEIRSAAELHLVVAQFASASAPLTDSLIDSLEHHIETRQAQLAEGPFPGKGFHNGTPTLGHLCYLLCRYLSPARIVETGVAYGVTSAYILQALDENSRGQLDSIDLPPLAADAEKYVGEFVPRELRNRWKLHIGPAKWLLPQILQETGPVDIFVHDSLHTYSHMKWEFETALRNLRPGGVIIADDIEGNRAFEEITRHPSVASWFAIRQEGKDALCGALRTRS